MIDRTEIQAIHVVLATIVAIVFASWTGVIVFSGGDALAEFIVTWFLALAVVWKLDFKSRR